MRRTMTILAALLLAACASVEVAPPCRPVDAMVLSGECTAVATQCAPEPAPCPKLDDCFAKVDAREVTCQAR